MKRQIAFPPSDSVLPLNDLGRQRRQARYPACSACSGLSKNRTFSRRGRRAGQDGRQYTPVLDTANTNSPSWAASRATTAFQRGSSVASGLGRGADIKLSVVSMALAVIVRKAYGEVAERTIRILRTKRNM